MGGHDDATKVDEMNIMTDVRSPDHLSTLYLYEVSAAAIYFSVCEESEPLHRKIDRSWSELQHQCVVVLRERESECTRIDRVRRGVDNSRKKPK